MKALVGVVVLAACGFEHGVPADNGPGDDGGGSNNPPGEAGAPDAMPDAPSPNCFGSAPFGVCLTTVPTQPLVIAANIDTNGTAPSCNNGGGVVMMVGGTESCVLAGTDITFSGFSTTGSSGTRPVVLVATGTITIGSAQTLDARSASTGGGPGANPTDCGLASNGTGAGGNGGGGAGGSFGSKGGDGADGGGGTGGAAKAASATPLVKLRGGCPGGSGAAGGAASAGGAGGGTVLMIAKTKIQIDGILTVSGAGGLGGQASKGGGGGGGSGGMIVLHTPMLSIGTNARLFANGGGGGGGAGGGTDGASGEDATMFGSAAAGGAAGGAGTTAGGAGAFKAQAAGTPANGGGGSGGGGGGGGVGVIRVLSGQQISGNNVSPAPS